MLVIALQDSVIAKSFRPFWRCLLQSGQLLYWKQTRAKPRVSPAAMWQTGLCPMDTTELWSQPKYQISWLNNLCFVFFWAALLLPEGAMPWAGGGERLEGQYEGQEGFLCACSGSYSLPWTFTVAGARDGHDPVSLFLDSSSCGSSIFYSKNYENSGVYAVPLSVKSEALVSVWLTTLPSVAGYVLKIWPEVQNHHFFLWRFAVLVNNPGWIFTLVIC